MAVVNGGFFNSCASTNSGLHASMAVKKVAIEPPPFVLVCRGCAAFLHNVVMVHTISDLVTGMCPMNHNATLCN